VEELRLREARGPGGGASFDEGRPHLYAAAFRDFGVDVEALPEEEAAARLRARPSLAVALAAALDDWARTARRQAPDQSKRLWALAAAVDPDPCRGCVRQGPAAGAREARGRRPQPPPPPPRPPPPHPPPPPPP